MDVHPHGPQGQRGARPSTVADIVQLCSVVWIDCGGQFLGGKPDSVEALPIFLLTQECQYKKRGCYSPWRPWAKPQQPPVMGVIAHTATLTL
jgi:hypothetical protein